MSEPVSTVKALQTYFSAEPHGRKIEMAEFKALTDKDKQDFADMLRAQGFNISDR